MTHVSSIVTLGALVLAGPRAAFQQALRPPLETRRMAERHSVVVRMDDSLGQVLSYGMGLIVAEEGAPGEIEGRFIVATAKHVVRSGDATAVVVKVLPYKHVHWIDAEVLATGEVESSDPQEDHAFLAVDRRRTEFVHGALVTSLTRSPVQGQASGEELWALGYDQDYAETAWGTGQIEEASETLVSFSGGGVRRGWSGGVLVNRAGALALTVTVGNRGKGCKAVPFSLLAQAARAASVPFQLEEPVLAEAFRNCLVNDLLVSLCESPRNRWLALSVDREVTLGFEGRWMTYGPDNNPGREGTSGTWSTKISGGKLELSLDGRPDLLGDQVAREYLPSTDVEVHGHLLLSAKEGEAVRYLALPQRVCETFAARYLATASGSDMAQVTIEPRPVQPMIRVLGGELAPMAFYLRTDGPFDRNEPLRVPFTLPESWLGHPVSLVGRLLGHDAIDALDGTLRTSWRQMPLEVFDEASGSVLVRIDRRPESPNDFGFRAEFEPLGRRCQLLLREVDPKQNSGAKGLVLQAPVLVREKP